MTDPFKIPELGARPHANVDASELRQPAPRSPQPPASSFTDVLANAVGEVQRLENEADQTIRQLVAGEITDVTEAMVAIEKADVSFQTMMAVRNKIVQAYEEVMRMQV